MFPAQRNNIIKLGEQAGSVEISSSGADSGANIKHKLISPDT
jgi:hypothetical protein